MICLSGYFMVGGETRVRGEDSVEDREVDEVDEVYEVYETQVDENTAEGGGVSGAPPRQHSIYQHVIF
jgi:hypothetical protein